MALTLAQLQKIMPHAGEAAQSYLPHLNAAMSEFQIDQPRRIMMFLATIAHESNDLRCVEENLNYSAAGLCKTWPSRFPTLQAALPYNRQPEKIANKVYANRGGNRDEVSGDGWKHRGAGLIQLTFKNNQFACALALNIDPEHVSDWLRTPEGACRSAAWFWATHGCNAFADRGDFDGVCDIINIGRKTAAIGDAIGFASRAADLKLAEQAVA